MVEGEEETALLFQCGVYDFTGEELFYFDFVRQFTIEEDGYMEQLHCEFVFEPIEELRKLETSLPSSSFHSRFSFLTSGEKSEKGGGWQRVGLIKPDKSTNRE